MYENYLLLKFYTYMGQKFIGEFSLEGMHQMYGLSDFSSVRTKFYYK